MIFSEVVNVFGFIFIIIYKYQIFKILVIKGIGLEEVMEWWVFFVYIFFLQIVIGN